MKVFTTDNKESNNSSKVGRLSNYYIEPDIIWIRIISKENCLNLVQKKCWGIKNFLFTLNITNDSECNPFFIFFQDGGNCDFSMVEFLEVKFATSEWVSSTWRYAILSYSQRINLEYRTLSLSYRWASGFDSLYWRMDGGRRWNGDELVF